MSTETTTTEVTTEVTTATETLQDPSTSSTSTTETETPSTTTSSQTSQTTEEVEKTEEVKTEETKTEETPEEDGYELELPENSALSEEQLTAFAEEAGKLGLKKEDAERLLGMLDKTAGDNLTKGKSEWGQEVTRMRTELLSAPEFTGTNAQASWESVGMAIETFGDESFKKAMMTDGIGDNLAVARFLKKIGDAMRDPSTPPAKGVQLRTDTEVQEKSKALRMYPEFDTQK